MISSASAGPFILQTIISLFTACRSEVSSFTFISLSFLSLLLHSFFGHVCLFLLLVFHWPRSSDLSSFRRTWRRLHHLWPWQTGEEEEESQLRAPPSTPGEKPLFQPLYRCRSLIFAVWGLLAKIKAMTSKEFSPLPDETIHFSIKHCFNCPERLIRSWLLHLSLFPPPPPVSPPLTLNLFRSIFAAWLDKWRIYPHAILFPFIPLPGGRQP